VIANDMLGGSGAGNYILTNQPTGLSANIFQKGVTVGGLSIAQNKTYDGNTNAVITGGALVGLIPADTSLVTLTQQGNFVTPNAGSGITVIANDMLGGSGAGNYILTNQPTGLSANIFQKGVTVGGLSIALDKTYDGNTNAVITGGTLVGLIPADTSLVTLTQQGNFVTPNAGSGITVIANDVLGGSGARNYILTNQPTGLSANVTSAPVTVIEGTPVVTLVNGQPVVTLVGGGIVGVLPGDANSVLLTQTGSLGSPFTGNHIIVNVTNSISGSAASNYQISLVIEPAGGLFVNAFPPALPTPPFINDLNISVSTSILGGLTQGVIDYETDNSISCS
jgi:hypothetical protein